MISKKLLIVCAVLTIITQAIAEGNPQQNQPPLKTTSDRSDYKKSISKDCATSYSLTCLKLDVVSWVDKLNEDENYSILPGVTLVREEKKTSDKSSAEIVSELAREFPSDPDARLDAFLVKKVTGFLHSHSIKLDLLSAKDLASARSYGLEETGRGKGGGGGGGGKKGGGLGMLLAAAAMMKGTLLALGLAGLAALAGKALMTALISLLLSAIIGLKGLTHGGKETTVEVVAKPVYSHSHSHSEEHGGHGRAGFARNLEMVPLPLGLRPEYKPA